MMTKTQPNMNSLPLLAYLLVIGLLTACTPLIQPPLATTTGQDESQAVANVRQILMQQLHADASAVEVLEVTEEKVARRLPWGGYG